MAQRSRRGCWTCKKRHKKCDETRPVCRRCVQAGIECTGYEVRLTWGSPVTSASPPTSNTAVNTSNRRRRSNIVSNTAAEAPQSPDLSPASVSAPAPEPLPTLAELDLLLPQYGQGAGAPADVLLDDDTAQRLMDEFAARGHETLMVRSGHDTLLKTKVVPMCSSSLPLRHVCIAYQAILRADTAHLTPVYMQSSLSHYLDNLGVPDKLELESTLATGIMLCSVSINCLYVWTPLLTGLHGVLQQRGLLAGGRLAGHASPLVRELFEVMSLMDITCLTLNRHSQPLGLWKHYLASEADPSGIQPTSGLPYSLINIMADLDTPSAEYRLQQWPGALGDDLVEVHLWEAFRYAGILHSRALLAAASQSAKSHDKDPMIESPQSVPGSGPLPCGRVLLRRALASVQAIIDSGAFAFREPLARAVLYPLFVVGVLAEAPEDRRITRVAFQYLEDPGQETVDNAVAELVSNVWDRARADADDAARMALAAELAAEKKVELHLY